MDIAPRARARPRYGSAANSVQDEASSTRAAHRPLAPNTPTWGGVGSTLRSANSDRAVMPGGARAAKSSFARSWRVLRGVVGGPA